MKSRLTKSCHPAGWCFEVKTRLALAIFLLYPFFFRHLAFCTELKKLFLSRSPFQTLRGALAFQKFPGRQILRKRLSSIHADLRCQGTWVQTRSWCHCSCRRHTCSWGLKPHLPARREWKSTERWWGMREECVHLFRKSCEQEPGRQPRHSPRAGDARRVDSQSLDNTYKHRRHEFLSLSILTEISVNFRNLWYHWEGTSTTGKKTVILIFWCFLCTSYCNIIWQRTCVATWYLGLTKKSHHHKWKCLWSKLIVTKAHSQNVDVQTLSTFTLKK